MIFWPNIFRERSCFAKGQPVSSAPISPSIDGRRFGSRNSVPLNCGVSRHIADAMATAPTHGNTLDSVLPEDLSAALFCPAHRVTIAANQTLFLAGALGDGCYRVD